MRSTNKYIVNVLTTGFVTLVILSVLFFWARKTCQVIFYGNLVVGKTGQLKIQPSGLVPDLDNSPDVAIQSSIEAGIGHMVMSHSLGVLQDLWSLEHGKFGEFCIISGNKDKGSHDLVLFDKNSGLFVYFEVSREKRGWSKKAKLYAGPKGISKTADKNLGQFSEPGKNLWRGRTDSFTLFDKLLSRYFQIRFCEEAVVEGTQLPEDYSPLQMGKSIGFDKNGGLFRSLVWSPPLRERATAQDKENKKIIRQFTKDKAGRKKYFVSAAEEQMALYSERYSLILEKSGEIRKLDNKTLAFSGPIGYLPSAPPFGQFSSMKPKNLSAYTVRPFTINNEYAGTIAGSISREAIGLQIAVFDKDGKLIERKGAHIDPFNMAGGPALTIINYLLENLQPAFLGMLSYFTASSFEATAGHRAIFVLPNSFVAMFSRYSIGIVGPFFGAMLIISPSIILGLLLGWRVYKDAAVTGFSKRAKRYWLIGTICFGISAYITYRLTCPKDTLVTCQNCGKLKRPDMARCHRCGSKWQVPELTPPTWRVID